MNTLSSPTKRKSIRNQEAHFCLHFSSRIVLIPKSTFIHDPPARPSLALGCAMIAARIAQGFSYQGRQMPWKLAVHSISWGHQSLSEILQEAKAIGFEGVELFQHPADLGGPQTIIREFRRNGLRLLGISAGSFEERCQFVRDLAQLQNLAYSDVKLPYIYVDEWRESDTKFQNTVKEGLRLAIHPHMYKPIQTMKEAACLLLKYPSLRFLPDIAHLRIAGEDLHTALRDYFAQIEAIHVKDWREDVGRSYQFYARGFCELGLGDVDLVSVLTSLFHKAAQTKPDAERWLIVEQDSTATPFESAKRSFDWLQRFIDNQPR